MKKAFTLAEVLITLGVIGTVAALVLPGVLSSFEKQKTTNKLKKGYASINAMYKTILYKTGCEDLACTGLFEVEEAKQYHYFTPDLAKKWVELAGIKNVKYNFTDRIGDNPVSCGLVGKRCASGNISEFCGYFQTPDGIAYNITPMTGCFAQDNQASPRDIDGGETSAEYYERCNKRKMLSVTIIPNPNHRDMKRPAGQKYATLGLNNFKYIITNDANTVEPAVRTMNGMPLPRRWYPDISASSSCVPNGAPLEYGSWANGFSCAAKIIEDGWEIKYWDNKNAGCYERDTSVTYPTWKECGT